MGYVKAKKRETKGNPHLAKSWGLQATILKRVGKYFVKIAVRRAMASLLSTQKRMASKATTWLVTVFVAQIMMTFSTHAKERGKRSKLTFVV